MEQVHGQDGGATTRTQSGVQLVPRVPILAKTTRKRPASAAVGSPAKRVAQSSSTTTTTVTTTTTTTTALTTGQSRQPAEDVSRIVERVPDQRQLEQLFPPGQSVGTTNSSTRTDTTPPTNRPRAPPSYRAHASPQPSSGETHSSQLPSGETHSSPGPPPFQPPIPFDQQADVERADVPVQDEGALDYRPGASGDDEIDRLVDMHWTSMQTRTRHGGVMETLNVRLWDGAADGANATLRNPQAWERLLEAWERQPSRVKLNCSVGCVLENKTNAQLRYFHASANNATVFPTPRLVSSRTGLERFFDELLNVDLQEQAIRRRPSTQWKLRFLTNISFYLFKLKNMARIGGDDGKEKLPEFIKRNRNVVALDGYDDNLCFFRCLYLHMNPKGGNRPPKRRVTALLAMFLRHSDAPTNVQKFGVSMDDLVLAEKCFGVRIIVLCSRADGSSVVSRTSTAKTGETLYLNVSRGHFSYIRNIDAFAKSYVCQTCDACFDRFFNCKRHKCRPDKASRYAFKGGVFESPPTIFSKLSKFAGIVVGDEQDRRYYRYVITYDIECFLPSTGTPASTHSTTYDNTHEFLSVSVCSNVPGFRQPVCFVRKSSVSECVGRFVAYLDRVSHVAGTLVKRSFVDVFDKLRALTRRRQRREAFFGGDEGATAFLRANELAKLLSELHAYVNKVPVVGFNSQKYDINVMKAELFRQLQTLDDDDDGEIVTDDDDEIDTRSGGFIVKKNNTFPCVETGRLRFLDICNFIAPGYSYEKYLKAYKCEQQK